MKRVLLFAAAAFFAVTSAGVGATAWADNGRDSNLLIDEFSEHLFQMILQEETPPGDGQVKVPCEPGKDCDKDGNGQGGQGQGDGQGKVPCEPGKDCDKDGSQGGQGKVPPGQDCEPGQGKDCGKGGDGQGKVPGQGCEPGQDCEPGQGQECEPGQGQGDAGQCEPGQSLNTYRVDCRFHSNPQASGVRFCVASVTYHKYGKHLDRFRLGVGCDYETLYSGPAEFDPQAIADRISPKAAVFPTLEVPSDSLLTAGTYQSILDTFAGRLTGTCYVRPAWY